VCGKESEKSTNDFIFISFDLEVHIDHRAILPKSGFINITVSRVIHNTLSSLRGRKFKVSPLNIQE